MVVAAISLLALTNPSTAQEGVLIRCGPSIGYSFYFHEPTMSPDGPTWEKDQLSNGKIVLVKLGDEWDIQFDDSFGAYGYREDGANVLPLTESPTMLMVGAFHPNYADIYTFDLVGKKVAWSSNKLGPPLPKVSVMEANCS